MSNSIVETHRFAQVPIHASGKLVIARISGEVMWKLRENGGDWDVDHIYHLYLRSEDHGLVEVTPGDPLFDVSRAALRKDVRVFTRPAKPRAEDADIPISNEPYNPHLDNAVTEGAEQTSG